MTICGMADHTCSGRIEQHHDDYASDQTRPLCIRHHRLWHSEHGHAANYNPSWFTMKVRRELFERLALIAQAENRSTSNMLEVIVKEFLERLEVAA